MAHLKARDHREILIYPSASHALTPERLCLVQLVFVPGRCKTTAGPP
jgi:hypothetical protein